MKTQMRLTNQTKVSFVVTVNNSTIQDYVHPDDNAQPTYDRTPGFKPFTTPNFSATLLSGLHLLKGNLSPLCFFCASRLVIKQGHCNPFTTEPPVQILDTSTACNVISINIHGQI